MAISRSAHRVLVHIVTWNSAAHISSCVQSLVNQEGFTLGDNLAIHVTDNASTDSTVESLKEFAQTGFSVSCNSENLGFCGAHNQGVHRGVVGKFDSILILNPDVVLTNTSLIKMVEGLLRSGEVACVTPKLLRANKDLTPVDPAVLDAAGMELHDTLRHFDRGSGLHDIGQFDEECFVFGGTGACLLMSLPCAWSVSLPYPTKPGMLSRIYPQLDRAMESPRVQLFDEGFFAYREDADLAWRLRALGWRCLYCPTAVAYHVRVVVPEKRNTLPAFLNALSVRNRFLLQVNNWSPQLGWKVFLKGVVFRNALVVLGVILREWSSIPYLLQVFALTPRALVHRRTLRARRGETLGRAIPTTLAELNDQ